MSDLFPSTLWTQIRNGAKDNVARRYWAPVHRYLTLKGLTHEDAEDMTQTVFVHISRDGFLESADRAKGRFRALLVAVTENLLKMWWREKYAEKRRADRPPLSLDEANLTAIAGSTAPPDQIFARAWAEDLLKHALDRLRAERAPQAAALESLYLLGRSYAEIDPDEAKVKNLVFRGKARLGEILRDLVREYSGSSEEFEDELRDLQCYLTAASP